MTSSQRVSLPLALLAMNLVLCATLIPASYSPVEQMAVSEDHSRVPCADRPYVNSFDVQLHEMDVPEEQEIQMCSMYEVAYRLPDPFKAYTVVAFEPIIGHHNVTHHMILFGCSGHASDPWSWTPHTCSAADNQCRNWMVQWSLGLHDAICSPPQAGFRIGAGTDITSFLLQVHWNNEHPTEGMTDSSGIRVYYSTDARKFEQGNVQIGQNDLEIPGGQANHEEVGGCSSECTDEWLVEPIYLTRVHLHMHYLGSGGVLEVVRAGQVVGTALEAEGYDYRDPTVRDLATPMEVKPGDELRLTCRYNSRDSHGGMTHPNKTLFWGEGTNGEMCYAFVSYYPKVQGFDQCIQFAEYDVCSATGFAALGECVFMGFIRAYNNGLADEILKHCVDNNASLHPGPNTNPTTTDLRRGTRRGAGRLCSPACDVAVTELTGHPCMQGRLGKETMRVYLRDEASWPQVREVLDTAARSCQD